MRTDEHWSAKQRTIVLPDEESDIGSGGFPHKNVRGSGGVIRHVLSYLTPSYCGLCDGGKHSQGVSLTTGLSR